MGVLILQPEKTVSFGRLKAFIQEALEKLGLPDGDAATVAALMAEADLQGSDGHGVSRLPQYARRIKAGGFNVRPNIHIVREQTSTAVLNGDNGMGHLVMKRAAELAIEKARATGIAWVNSQFSNHAGPASLYATMPLAHDMIGLYFAVGNANHLPPWGGLDMLLSTNPIAAAIPAGDEKPIVLDMATTVAAYGKVKTRALRGESMPEGWMIDREGKALTDPKRADEGMLLPLGGMEAGYKGYGLAMIIGLLAGTLGGAAMGREVVDFNRDDDSVTNTGQAIAAINVAAFGDVACSRKASMRWCATFAAAAACRAFTASSCRANAAMKRGRRGHVLEFQCRGRWCADWTRLPTNSRSPSSYLEGRGAVGPLIRICRPSQLSSAVAAPRPAAAI
jgi:L-2-hydroxycarboxylate dehydrogenase (NAD+)